MNSRVLSLLFVFAQFEAVASAQRLPTTVVPEHYDITVAPDLAAATFSGSERIRIQVGKPVTAIVLNAAEIEFDTVSVTSGGRTQQARVSTNAGAEQATLTLEAPVAAGAADIAVKYRGILNDQLRGFYLSQANNRRYAVTQLEATDARRMFPSFDEPAFKATFALTAVIDSGDHAVSNGAVLSDTPGPAAGKHTVTFETTSKMSTYLVALAVGDFECIGADADAIPVRICSTPDKKAYTGFALEAATEALRYFNRYFSVRYPFRKLDIVAVPDFSAGAMENTGAIFYRETFLLADPKSASLATRKNIALVLAHEIAHQWFGDLVTMQWWDDIWLNEGFANWMQAKPVQAWKPAWHIELDDVQSNQTAMNLDALRSTRPIRSKAATPAEISELFDGIAYEKGAAVLRMIESWVGEQPFRAGVNAYVDRFKYGNARAEDFWGTLAKSTGKPVDRVMASFVDQPGVPMVTVDVRCGSGKPTVSLSQERYVRDSAPVSATAGALWSIPVCVKTETRKTVCDVVSSKTARIALDACPSWVMPNAGARGYYRSAYSPGMLRTMATGVAALTPAERIALVADEWALVRAGRHDVGSFLDLASGFTSERNSAVMETLLGTLNTIGEDVAEGAARDRYRAWLSSSFGPTLNEVGLVAAPNETDETRRLRAALVETLGFTAHDPGVLSRAREIVLQELSAPGTIEPTLLNAVVGVAATDGDAALYEKYLARSRSATDPEEKYRYLNGLTGFIDPALVRRTMDYVLGPEVRNQDAKIFIAGLLTSTNANHLVWPLLQARWDEVQKKTGEFVGNTVIVGALSAFCDARTLGEIEQFFSLHRVPDAERTLQQSIERITSCIALSSKQRDKLAAWLK